eukprot:3360851-Rhodomonas_salina.1
MVSNDELCWTCQGAVPDVYARVVGVSWRVVAGVPHGGRTWWRMRVLRNEIRCCWHRVCGGARAAY